MFVGKSIDNFDALLRPIAPYCALLRKHIYGFRNRVYEIGNIKHMTYLPILLMDPCGLNEHEHYSMYSGYFISHLYIELFIINIFNTYFLTYLCIFNTYLLLLSSLSLQLGRGWNRYLFIPATRGEAGTDTSLSL